MEMFCLSKRFGSAAKDGAVGGIDRLHPGSSFVRSTGEGRKRGDRQELVMDDEGTRWTGDGRTSIVKASMMNRSL